MPTIVGILKFISMINTISERLKARNLFICRYFSFYEQLKFCAQLSWAWKKFYNLEAWLYKNQMIIMSSSVAWELENGMKQILKKEILKSLGLMTRVIQVC